MESNDPATDALRCWAADKQTHYPGQDGSIAVNGNSVDAMAWGGPITFPRKGDTLPPPDERARVGKFGHGDVKYVGPSEGEADGDAREGVNGEGKKKRRFSRLFRRKEKGGDGKGWSEGGDVVR